MRTAEDLHEKFKADMANKHGVTPAPDIGRLMRAVPLDFYASAIKHNKTGWEPLLFPGRNPLSMWKTHEHPASSESRLKRLEERYRPVVEEYILLGPPGRKHLLDQWIPAIEDAELEKALKNAIEEQWRLEIAPGQKNDPDRLPRKLPDGQERPAEAFVVQQSSGSESADEEGGEADDAATVGADEEGTTAEERGSYKNLKSRIGELERTFGFGYQLLRSCAVDGYEMPFFQEHVWASRTLRAMKPPPGAGLAGDKLGEESLPGGPGSALREQTRRDRILLWERLKTFVQKYQSEASGGGAGLVLGPVSIMLGKGLGRTERSTNETLADAVRSIFTLSANPERLNAGDKEQEGSGERLSLYPEGLTLADKAVFRARRNVIEGERQREDLKIYVGQRMQLLQSAFLPIAYAYNPDFGAGTHVEEQLVEDLNRAAEGGEGAESDNTNTALSPLAKTLAKQAADGLKEFRAVSDEHEAERDAEVLKLYDSTACVRLFAWASRHQLLGRMLRQNLLVRLKVLATDPPKFGMADLIERETPTAVGAVTNQTGSPLALKENRKYTNLFFLLRDNVGRKLDDVAPLQWKDFDDWGFLYPGLVRTTPWDKEYAPPWEWPGGIPPDRRRTKKAVKRAANNKDEKDGSYYRNWFYTAVTGIAVFAVGLAVVFRKKVSFQGGIRGRGAGSTADGAATFSSGGNNINIISRIEKGRHLALGSVPLGTSTEDHLGGSHTTTSAAISGPLPSIAAQSISYRCNFSEGGFLSNPKNFHIVVAAGVAREIEFVEKSRSSLTASSTTATTTNKDKRLGGSTRLEDGKARELFVVDQCNGNHNPNREQKLPPEQILSPAEKRYLERVNSYRHPDSGKIPAVSGGGGKGSFGTSSSSKNSWQHRVVKNINFGNEPRVYKLNVLKKDFSQQDENFQPASSHHIAALEYPVAKVPPVRFCLGLVPPVRCRLGLR
eukprot:g11923.t1